MCRDTSTESGSDEDSDVLAGVGCTDGSVGHLQGHDTVPSNQQGGAWGF